jgi:60 kDa SS-A/Ro ribonucleoprotein
MKFSKYISAKKTPQNRAIPGAGQVPNSEGGYTWQVDTWTQLDRFLILGTEGGTYYIGEPKLTVDNATSTIDLIKKDGERVVNRIVDISLAGRAAKNGPAIFALALCATYGEPATRQAAFAALPKVCRTGTHLFQFASECEEMRGWGRGLRRAVGNWYSQSEPSALTYQAMKYQQREGWSHRDLLRLSHPKPQTEEHKQLFKWIVSKELEGENARIEAFERLTKAEKPSEAAALIREFRLPRECVPTALMASAEVWEALLEEMPLTALVRNLANLTKCGLLTVGSDASRKVVNELKDSERIRKARVHPIAVLLALTTYGSGMGFRGKGTWFPVPAITEALNEAYYLAFANVEPTGKRYLLGVDVSGSMDGAFISGTRLSARAAASAMAMVTMATEANCLSMAFSTSFQKLNLTPKMRLSEAIGLTTKFAFGGTDCAVPMIYATKHKIPVDVFVIYTDSETWFGKIHPSQALVEYRQKMGIAAKLVVMGMCSNQFSIAAPRDAGMLDVVGFDASAPVALREFATS